jgi:four helix bundle protein
MKSDQSGNIILDKSFKFSLKVMEYCEPLYAAKRFRMADQLFRSGTSIGANVREAQNAESRFDFVHKLKIAAKECDETGYWLELCEFSGIYPSTAELRKDLGDISRILDKIISTNKKALNNKLQEQTIENAD